MLDFCFLALFKGIDLIYWLVAKDFEIVFFCGSNCKFVVVFVLWTSLSLGCASWQYFVADSKIYSASWECYVQHGQLWMLGPVPAVLSRRWAKKPIKVWPQETGWFRGAMRKLMVSSRPSLEEKETFKHLAGCFQIRDKASTRQHTLTKLCFRCILLWLLIMAAGGVPLLEQPASSLMNLHTRFVWSVNLLPKHRIRASWRPPWIFVTSTTCNVNVYIFLGWGLQEPFLDEALWSWHTEEKLLVVHFLAYSILQQGKTLSCQTQDWIPNQYSIRGWRW